MLNLNICAIICAVVATVIIFGTADAEEWAGAQDNAEIDYYTNLIINVTEEASTYQLPTNAYEYRSSGKRQNYGSYDFVVIGAGAGGTVVANRLTEIKNWNVLVLEAGDYGNKATDVPNLNGPMASSKYNWGLNSTPQTTGCLNLQNHECPYPRGKGVGGTTLINGLVHARGYKSDFDKWEKVVASKRWGYDSVLHYFKKSENFVHNDKRAPYERAYHGTGGYLNVEYPEPRRPQLNAYLEANIEMGFNIVDYNANKLGASLVQLNTIHGRRMDDCKAFIHSVRQRNNLKVLTNSYVTKLQIINKVVIGVEFSHNGKNYIVEATKEVILAGGAFGTPQILMWSGIGPRKHLEELEIDVIADLEVGTTLRDNSVFYGISVSTNYTEPIRPLKEYVKEYLNGVGQLASPSNDEGIGFYESSYSKGTGVPEIEMQVITANATSALAQRMFHLTDQTFEDLWKYVNIPQTFNVWVIDLHAQSVGTIRLKSKNPYEYPLINSNFISDPENRDINTLYEGIQLVLRLLDTKAFKAMNATLQGGPLRACKHHEYLSKGYWYCALRQLTINLYHPLGTCPMGTDPKKGAVVDSDLRVFGFNNLRIADASVFPFTLAGHPNAPTVMVGEQLGDLVKLTYHKKIK